MKIIDWIKQLTTEDFKHAWVRFSKTVVFAAIVLSAKTILVELEGAENILEALQNMNVYMKGLEVLLESLVIGLLWGVDKLRRSSNYK